MKRCPKCNQEKLETEFNNSGKRINPYCKECQRAYCRQHYIDNKVKYNKKRYNSNKKNRQIQKIKIQKIKESKPCTDCLKSYPYYVMQFDHLSDKLENISNMIGRCTWSKIEEEIAKCELVCANCHFIRTYKRGIGQW